MKAKTTFAGLAKKALAGTLALSMVMSVNLLTMADSDNTEKGETPVYNDALADHTIGRYDLVEGSEGIANDYFEVNGATYDTVNGKGVITLGFLDEAEERGVQMVNPFSSKKELNESLVSALQRTGKTFQGWTYPDKDGELVYNRIYDVATTKEEAINWYNENLPAKQAEYNRQQIQDYAKRTTVKKIVLADAAGNVVEGTPIDGQTYTVIDDPQNGTMLLSDAIYIRGAAAKKTFSGRVYASSSNFWKTYLNGEGATTEEVIQWSNGALDATTDYAALNKAYYEANKDTEGFTYKFQSFEERYPDFVDPAKVPNLPDEFVYPYPTWSQGAGVSLWVKLPASEVSGDAVDASGAAVTPEAVKAPTILEIKRNNATLYMLADGTVKFEDPSVDHNMYKAVYEGDTPLKKAGEWVYVTLALKNDNIDVYYNGVKAEAKNKAAMNTSTRDFNYGTGYETEDTDERIKTCVLGGNYKYILKGFGESTTYTDYSKYTFNGVGTADYVTIMGLLTSLDNNRTQIFLGGGNGAQEPAFSQLNEGMSFSTVEMYDIYVSEEDAKAAFDREKAFLEPSGSDTEEPGKTDAPDKTTAPGETDAPDKTTAPGGTDAPDKTTAPGGTDAPDKTTAPTGNPSQTTEPTQVPEPNIILGDADGSGKVDLEDARATLMAALAITKLEGDNFKAADVNNNGKIELDDANAILQAALGIKPLEQAVAASKLGL